ncbi:hypothetical protein L2E82_31493 [Cichorium intybus]|uniref:Uncharacterized protein n=1 Tax=Cichorium intybus TaxID=13427 RepID=A0ACB9BFE7_CICIN|nr:hypothetical protein L2E82_31493 [Cichorium intybus]
MSIFTCSVDHRVDDYDFVHCIFIRLTLKLTFACLVSLYIIFLQKNKDSKTPSRNMEMLGYMCQIEHYTDHPVYTSESVGL